ncbi:gluconate 2-dehydrogenase subunit 3 family protein [Paracoccus stylophorae]|uniref:Gluconate 2-dehydrogenase subunit 3 family protein n=1 Tax=Paracoccus stylophorae TaxID=659350 RepID=A0ABY7SW25_9RHOB|nr:gluconate 2-dehydrogenase subunit 3 family protein [Paracoccus stylophorae]WCR11035.1 gluconate 2-dehydrogenase subunit 3 family protein [Paracoccus stylophorae]
MTGRFHPPYPGWNVLDKWDSPSFNDVTRAVLRKRLEEVPKRRFFTRKEWPTLQALCDTVLPQNHNADPVPLANWIDAALHEERGSGTRHADMPAPPRAWRQGLAALDAEARARGAADFASLMPDARGALLHDVDAGRLRTDWQRLPARRFFRNLVLAEIVAIYYSHPTGQSEIGFGGPASPRGYVRLQPNRADAWEAPPGQWEETP